MATGVSASPIEKFFQLVCSGNNLELAEKLRDGFEIPEGTITAVAKYRNLRDTLFLLCSFAQPHQVNECYGSPLLVALTEGNFDNADVLHTFLAGIEAFRISDEDFCILRGKMTLFEKSIYDYRCKHQTYAENLKMMQ